MHCRSLLQQVNVVLTTTAKFLSQLYLLKNLLQYWYPQTKFITQFKSPKIK